MEKINPLSLFVLLTIMFQLSFGQKISKKEAQQLLEKTITCLKNSDTATFINLWYLDDTGRPYDNSPFTRKDAIKNYNDLKLFLDTALTKNLPFDQITVEKFDSFAKYKVKYKIKAWFKYDEQLKYYKGYGVLVDYINGKWAFRFPFERSTSYRDK